MLMSAGLPVPEQIFGHGWVHLRGERMSKTLGTVVDPLEAAQRFGADPLRLYLVKEIAFGSDGDFTWERFEDRYNVDLANNLGNLVSRVAAMADKYRQGRLLPSGGAGRLAEVASQALEAYRVAMDAFALESGVAAAFRIVDATNEFIASSEPWALARDEANAGRLSDVLFDTAEAVRIAALLLVPVMPRSASEILRRLGEPDPATVTLDGAAWRNHGERHILKAEALWPRADTRGDTRPQRSEPGGVQGPPPGKNDRSTDVDQKDTQPPAVLPTVPDPGPGVAPPPAPAPAAGERRSEITIDDFMKTDLRVAKVLTAEKVPNSRKLVKMTVDVGTEQRTLVAGIAEAYEPEQLVGRTIVMVFNLKPAKLMGIESNGMVLAASPEGGRPTLVTFDQLVPPGTRVR
jgi:methionyl-tRNA synthetase